MSEVFESYSLYTGSGIMMILFFVCLIYIGLKDKNRSNTSVLFFGSIILVFCMFLPPLYWLYVNYVDGNTFWRMWWMAPVSVTLSYVGTKLFEKHRSAGLILSVVVILLGGGFSYAYQRGFEVAKNPYQLSENIIAVADYLEEIDEDGVIMATVPHDMVSQIRQYKTNIVLAYGREQLDPAWKDNLYQNEYFQAFNRVDLSFESLMPYASYYGVEYIVLPMDLNPVDTPRDGEFTFLANVGGYSIFQYDVMRNYYDSLK